jgi:hypothetical protein
MSEPQFFETITKVRPERREGAIRPNHQLSQ